MPNQSNPAAAIGPATCGAGIAITLLAVCLHVTFMFHAGGLWRDEAVTCNIATSQSLTELWRSLSYDSFPGFFHLILRMWIGSGLGAHDLPIRFLGCLVGLGVIGTLWVSGMLMSRAVPLVSLAFFGLSPLVVRTTDAIRAYGLGTLLIVLTLWLTWRVVSSFSISRAVAAAIAAVLSVQALYQNAFFLLAICVAGMVVTLRSGRPKTALTVFGIGVAAGLSLLPYVTIFRRLGEVKPLIAQGVGLPRIIQIFSVALSAGGTFILWLWLVLAIVAIAIAICAQIRSITPQFSDSGRDLSLFSLLTMVGALIAFLAWLIFLGFPTQSWYYVPLIGLVAVSLDAIYGVLPRIWTWRIWQPLLVTVVSGLTIFRALTGVQFRQTNIDMIAAEIARSAAKEDFILVDPWFCGASFGRYYKGSASWTTLPPVEDQTRHRLDLFKKYMMALDPIKPVRERIAATLKSHHRVWLVVDSPFLSQSDVPPELPPAPKSQSHWNHDAYSRNWAIRTADFVGRQALQRESVPILGESLSNPFETLRLFVLNGWRDDSRSD